MSNNKKLEKKIFYSKDEYLNAIDIEDKKIDNAELRIEELKRMLENYNSSSSNKSTSNTDKKAKQNEIPVDKKHEVVSIVEFDDYDYDKRRAEWHKKAGHNDKQVVCSICKDDDNWATVLLEDGRHICYYCWIKKPQNAKTKTTKKVSSTSKLKTIPSKKQTSKPTTKKVIQPKKHEVVDVALLDLYDYNKKLSIWRKSAGDNLTDQGCDKCGGKQYERTILLKDGSHVCWYCWIKKPEGAISVSQYNKKK